MNTRSHRNLRALCEGAIMVAAAQVLGYIKLFSLPNGGSITLSLLPVFIYCARWGFGYGMLSAFALSLLQLLLDGAHAIAWQSIIGDYILAYSAAGLAGLFHAKTNGLFKGTLAGCTARFIVAWITGATVWAEYMPDSFFGMTMTSPWLYSALYNGSYIFVSMLICLAVEAVLNRPLGRFIRGEDIS